jgi:hypothetical protein
MIGNNVEGLREAFKIVPPVLEGADDCEHLFVVDLVVSFRLDH